MKRIINALIDWYRFGKDQGYWFAFKYKLGIAKEGKDFFSDYDGR